ncbi:hypothetical protein [Pseudomonas cremoricolorata]|uniref:Uncharacterized protein n=1 Tax=Pseudomonas cremoricolorata TaxID=157783 RepID=A0A089YEQ4_9PSED|nr:hypothetical protein [Pseudomonas cremoricolorata]AIR90198.1 hypothetical protein LK03_13235 [Pseudomonas cremoricolorata]
MQTSTSIAFAQGLPRLEELLASTKIAREEARARVTPPLYQAKGVGSIWVISEIATGQVAGHAYQYETALVFVKAMEAGAASKRGLQ